MAKALTIGRNVIFHRLPTAQSLQLKRSLTTVHEGTSNSKRNVLAALGLATAGGLGLWYALEKSVDSGSLSLHPQKMDWPHSGIFATFDHSALRRGWQVYKQVCAACHSLNQLYYLHFVDVFLTEEEAKAEAAEQLIENKEPDDTGKKFTRPGKLFDKVVEPYPNVQAAKAANNNAYPPDLSVITYARHGGEDYVFSLLIGYPDEELLPAGVELGAGQAYNPYMQDGKISMPRQLWDGGIEYEDGTPATTTQQAKDVVQFLTWCAQPERDERKLYLLKLTLLMPIVTALMIYWKKHAWAFVKTQKFAFKTLPGREPPKRQ
jgi:ubiquinol-cytochrome c reductase cytochrome c1 subunit